MFDGMTPVETINHLGGLAFDDEPAYELSPDEETPTHLAEFEAAHDDIPPQREPSPVDDLGGYPQGYRRYFEGVLGRGDTVSVAGYASHDEDGTVVVSPPPEGEDGSFLLSDADAIGVASERRARALVGAVVGLFLVWFGASGLWPGVGFWSPLGWLANLL